MRSKLRNATLALTCLASATAAWADGAGADYVQGYSESVSAAPLTSYEFDPVEREAWLSDCHRKVAASRPRSGTAREGQGNHGECETYLEDYLARYRQGQVAASIHGHAAPGYAYVYPAQAHRMVSIPVVQAIDSRGKPIAYLEDTTIRPARRSIPRRDPATAGASSEVYVPR